MTISRRRFLSGVGAGMMATGAGLAWPGLASGQMYEWAPPLPPFQSGGEQPPNPFGQIPQCPHQGKRVLEMVFYGGLSPWETFWVRGVGSGQGAAFQDTIGNPVNVHMQDQEGAVRDFSWCAGGPTPNRVKYFGRDESQNPGNSIYWGPATEPLWDYRIFSRARMIALGHRDLPHEAAMPEVLTGLRLGNPRGAGLGAAISATYRPSGACQRNSRPLAYVLTPNDMGPFRGVCTSILNVGKHPGADRPVEFRVGGAGLGTRLLDAQPGADVANLQQRFQEQYAQRLRWQGDRAVDPVRSPQFDDYVAALGTLKNAGHLHALLGGDTLAADLAQSCNGIDSTEFTDRTASALDAAAFLLDPSGGNARYVGVFDGGVKRYSEESPYDNHDGAGSFTPLQLTMENLYSSLSHLAELIVSGVIDLDETMVVLTTEMGRTPTLADPDGSRDHWPYGMVQVLLGAPGNLGIAGTIDAAGSAHASDTERDSFQPAHLRAAVLMAAGVDPMGTFELGDLAKGPLAGVTRDDEMVRLIGNRVLGV